MTSDPLTAWAKTAPTGRRIFLNATAVAHDNRSILCLGAPGTGKSTLALALMSLGAQLIADDGVWVTAETNTLRIVRPDTAPYAIEQRGLGLVPSGPVVSEAVLHLVIDLDRPEQDRLPPARHATFEGVSVPLVRAQGQRHLAPALWQVLRYGWRID